MMNGPGEYEYEPKPRLGREAAVAVAFFVVAVALYGLPTAAKLPYPVLFQLAAVACLAAGVLVTVRHLLRSYRYRVAPSADGETELTVTERYGRRSTVVCRMALCDLLRVERPGTDGRPTGGGVLRYASGFRPEDLCLAEFRDGEDGGVLRILICADEPLFRLLNFHKQQ